MQSIGYLAPERQTYGWYVAQGLQDKMGIDADLIPEISQPELLLNILKGDSEHAACVVAYSNNLGKHAVPQIGESMKRFARTDDDGKGPQRLEPGQLCAIARTSIEQCLLGKDGTNLAHIRKVYAHPEGANQGSGFMKRKLSDITLIECSSNGEAVNRALEDNCVSSVAIGPEFAKNDEQIVIAKGIDNNPGSETSFALISNPSNPLILPKSYVHDGLYGAISYAKVNQLGDSQLPLALELFDVERYANRSTNSPASGMPVIGKDITSEHVENLKKLIAALDDGLPGFGAQASMGDRTVTLPSKRGVLEHNSLGPCPVIQIKKC